MARIMCSRTLWTALGSADQPPTTAGEPEDGGAQLGNWALKLFHRDSRQLILALNEPTYLTLVFSGAPRESFRTFFRDALHDALLDLGVDPLRALTEADAIETLPLVRLANRTLTGSLTHLEVVCQCELDYLTDLRVVQRNLNEFPHTQRPEPCVPALAVPLFLAESGRRGVARVH